MGVTEGAADLPVTFLNIFKNKVFLYALASEYFFCDYYITRYNFFLRINRQKFS